MQPNCKGKCFAETKRRFNFWYEYTNVERFKQNLPKIPRNCAECGYSILTEHVRCYCCNNPYRIKPRGNNRKKTTPLITKMLAIIR